MYSVDRLLGHPRPFRLLNVHCVWVWTVSFFFSLWASANSDASSNESSTTQPFSEDERLRLLDEVQTIEMRMNRLRKRIRHGMNQEKSERLSWRELNLDFEKSIRTRSKLLIALKAERRHLSYLKDMDSTLKENLEKYQNHLGILVQNSLQSEARSNPLPDKRVQELFEIRLNQCESLRLDLQALEVNLRKIEARYQETLEDYEKLLRLENALVEQLKEKERALSAIEESKDSSMIQFRNLMALRRKVELDLQHQKKETLKHFPFTIAHPLGPQAFAKSRFMDQNGDEGPQNTHFFTTPQGSPVYATAPGKVILTQAQSGFGNLVVLQHANRRISLYGNLQEMLVREGDTVNRGEQLGTSGRSVQKGLDGLYFELRSGRKISNQGFSE